MLEIRITSNKMTMRFTDDIVSERKILLDNAMSKAKNVIVNVTEDGYMVYGVPEHLYRVLVMLSKEFDIQIL